MRHLVILVLATALGACATAAPRLSAVDVRKVDGQETFVACTPELGATVDEVIAACGEPDKRMMRLGGGNGACVIYHTAAVASRTEGGLDTFAPHTRVAVCFAEKKAVRDAFRAAKGDASAEVVTKGMLVNAIYLMQ